MREAKGLLAALYARKEPAEPKPTTPYVLRDKAYWERHWRRCERVEMLWRWGVPVSVIAVRKGIRPGAVHDRLLSAEVHRVGLPVQWESRDLLVLQALAQALTEYL